MIHDAQPAAPSAADATPETLSVADQAVAANDMAAFKAARFAERTGTDLDVSADSSPAQPEDPAPDADSADPSSASPEKKAETRPDKRAAEHRVPELLKDRAKERERAERAEREVAELRARLQPTPDAKPADSSPAPAAETFPEYDAWLATNPTGSYERYLVEQTRHVVTQEFTARDQAAQARTQAEKATQSIKERDETFRSRIKDAGGSEFVETLSDQVKALRPFSAIRDAQGRWTEQPTGYHAVAEEVMGSESASALLTHFSDHPEDLDRIATLPPTQLLKELGKLEARIAPATRETTPPTLVTRAPRAATTLSTATVNSGDPIESAVARGDMSAFKAASQRERLARLRR